MQLQPADGLVCGDSRMLSTFVPAGSVAACITSPPYRVGKDYASFDDGIPFAEYLDLLRQVFGQCLQALRPGGLFFLNLANTDRKPYTPLDVYCHRLMLEAGYAPQGQIIWDKGASAGVSTAWGSWCRPSNPTLRDIHEFIGVYARPERDGRTPARLLPVRPQHTSIAVFSKGQWKLPGPGETDLTSPDFTAWTKSVWQAPGGWPQVAMRLAKLYSYVGGTVLVAGPQPAEVAAALSATGRRVEAVSPDRLHTVRPDLGAELAIVWDSPGGTAPQHWQQRWPVIADLLRPGGRLAAWCDDEEGHQELTWQLLQTDLQMRGTVIWDRQPQRQDTVWRFPTASAKRLGHPAPFPVELPERAMALATRPGDLVLDPFCGVGSTCVAAAAMGRRWIGVDIDPEYVRIARQRLSGLALAPAAVNG